MNELICYTNEVKVDRRHFSGPNPAGPAEQEAGMATQCTFCVCVCVHVYISTAYNCAIVEVFWKKSFQWILYFLLQMFQNRTFNSFQSLYGFVICFQGEKGTKSLHFLHSYVLNICSSSVYFTAWTHSHWSLASIITASNEPIINFSPPEPV